METFDGLDSWDSDRHFLAPAHSLKRYILLFSRLWEFVTQRDTAKLFSVRALPMAVPTSSV